MSDTDLTSDNFSSSNPDPRTFLPESAPTSEIKTKLEAPARLSLLQDLEILDAPVERTFEVLTELANRILGTPVSLISLVTDNRQFFVSSSGLPEPYCTQRETDLSHSFCQHVVKRQEPLVICDARNHPLVCDNLAVPNLKVMAYLGVPLVFHDGSILGSFCSIDGKPRQWTESDQNTLSKLADVVAGELETRKTALKEREQLELRLRQAQKMEAIGNFTSGIAHDFNHTLAAIQINTDLLKRRLENDDASMTHIDNIQGTIASANGVVKQLLSWSQPEKCQKEVLSLSQLVEDGLSLLRTLLPSSIVIDYRGPDGNNGEENADKEDCFIAANRDQINQILINLLGNAKDAMQGLYGKISIEVSEREIDKRLASAFGLPTKTLVRLRVKDEGCGMSKEILHRIHDPYFTTKSLGQGTGLGLWNVFGIAKAHSADIEIESEVNHGTTVTVTFPSVEDEDQHADPQPSAVPLDLPKESSVASEERPNDSLRVMVVDDEPVLADGIKEELEFHGHQVVSFLDGQTALDFFEAHSAEFDLVVSDQIMPTILGKDLVRKMKSLNPDIKAIICSGVVEAIEEKSDDGLGADFYLAKPFRLRELMDTIAKLK